MTQQEFIDRTGLTPTAEEFATIHRIYMACATLDKNEFCRDYKKHGMSRIVAQLLDALINEERKADAIFEKMTAVEQAANTRNLDMAVFLLGKAAAYDDPDFEYEALKLVSRGTAILIKIKEGYQLTDNDFVYIANNIDNLYDAIE
jgi:hypothetical protein